MRDFVWFENGPLDSVPFPNRSILSVNYLSRWLSHYLFFFSSFESVTESECQRICKRQ